MKVETELRETDQSPVAEAIPAQAPLAQSQLVYSSEHGEHAVQTGCGDSKPQTDDDGHIVYSPELYVEVEFKGGRRGYFLNEAHVELVELAHVIVEAEKGIDLGIVISLGETAYHKMLLRTKPCTTEPRKVLRLADDNDKKIHFYHRDQETVAFEICRQKIDKHHLDMKLIDVEYQFDRVRITFYFTADGRIDFRELVKDLASEYRTRIELRQIGVRDQAKRIGGIGNCGRDLCCSAWIDSFEHISTEMARLQNLPLNPFKLSGQCGRLKCCLAYESEVYEERLRQFPPLETRVRTSHGTGKIEKIDVFHDAVYLHFEKDNSWQRLTLDEIKELIRN